jgi:hypothetical protein
MLKTESAKKIVLGLFVCSVVLLQNGCSSSSVGSTVSGLTVSSSVQNGDVWASLNADLSSSGFIISSLNVPIVDPKNTSIEYGQISLSPVVCSSGTVCVEGSQLSLSINLTAVAALPTTTTDLPNGTPVPLSGLTNLIGLSIGKTGGVVYLDLSSNTAVIGVAFPFAALNGVGTYVPGLDIFDTLSFGNVPAYIGVFAGSGTNETGLALFVNASSVIYPTTTIPTTTADAVQAQAVLANAAVPSSSEKISLKANKGSAYQEYVLLSGIQSLGNKHTVLELK